MKKKLLDYYQRQRNYGRSTLYATALIPYKAARNLLLPDTTVRRLNGNVNIGFALYHRPLLVSYPRSGTNWIRYIIESITSKPTPGQTRLHTGTDYYIDRAHQAYDVMHRYRKVLMVIRDYREAIIRHHTECWQATHNVCTFLDNESIKDPPQWYIRNLQPEVQFQ